MDTDRAAFEVAALSSPQTCLRRPRRDLPEAPWAGERLEGQVTGAELAVSELPQLPHGGQLIIPHVKGLLLLNVGPLAPHFTG